MSDDSIIFHTLPSEIITIIAIWLSPYDLLNFALSCKALSTLISDQFVWRGITLNQFGKVKIYYKEPH
jgi:hypothetical protein